MKTELLDAAKQALQLQDVSFRDEHVWLQPDATPGFLAAAPQVMFKFTTGVLHDFTAEGQDPEGNHLTARFLEVIFQGHVRCLAANAVDDSTPDLLRLDIQVGLLYQRTGECSDEAVEEFVRANVPFHAIPYWREAVHAACSKRRLPPITVPMYQRFPEPARDSAAEAEVAGARSVPPEP